MKHARPDYNRIQDPASLIPENEPVFLIRGQDIIGPRILRYYAMVASAAGAADDVVMATLAQAKEMERWQQNQKSKVADMPPPKSHNQKALDEGFSGVIEWIKEYRYRTRTSLLVAKDAYEAGIPMPKKWF